MERKDKHVGENEDQTESFKENINSKTFHQAPTPKNSQ